MGRSRSPSSSTRSRTRTAAGPATHCITGRTFCTAAALLVLMGDRTPAAANVIAGVTSARCARALAAVVVVAIAAGCGSSRRRRRPPRRSIAPSPAPATFLATQQDPDGALRSRTYAALKDGWSLTPLAALALRMVPGPARGVRPRRRLLRVAALHARRPGRHLSALRLRDRRARPRRARQPRRDAIGRPATRCAPPRCARASAPTAAGATDVRSPSNLVDARCSRSARSPWPGRRRRSGAGRRARLRRPLSNPDGGFFFSPDKPDGNKAGLATGRSPAGFAPTAR